MTIQRGNRTSIFACVALILWNFHSLQAQQFHQGYEGYEIPASAEPKWTTGGTCTVANGLVTMNAGFSMLNPVYTDGSNAWNATSTGPGSTIEFRNKIIQTGTGGLYSTAISAGTDVDRFTLGIVASGTLEGALEIRGYTGSPLNTGTIAGFFPTAYNTYRMTILGRTAKVYLNNSPTAILVLNGSGGPLNKLMAGRMTALMDSAASSKWDYIRWTNGAAIPSFCGYKANTDPTLANPSWTEIGSARVINGLLNIYHGALSNPVFSNNQSAWHATASGPGSTIEFAMRVATEGTNSASAPQSACLLFGSDTDVFKLGICSNHGAGTLQVCGSNGAGLWTSPVLPNFNPTSFNVYRVTLTGRSISIYLNNNPRPIYTFLGSGGPNNTLYAGGASVSSSVRTDAVSQWDYLRFTNEAAQPPTLLDDFPGQTSRNLQGTGTTTGSYFGYTTASGSSNSGVGVTLNPGQSYTISNQTPGPCAVYVSTVVPNPQIQATWGGSAITIPSNQRCYYGNSEGTPQKSTIQNNRLFNVFPQQAGQLLAEESFVATGDFSAGPLVITLPSSSPGPAQLTSIRIRQLPAALAQLANYQNNPTANRRIIYNNDGFSYGFGEPGWQPAQLTDQINFYQNTDVKSVDWCAGASGVVNYIGTSTNIVTGTSLFNSTGTAAVHADMYGTDGHGVPLSSDSYPTDWDRNAANSFAALENLEPTKRLYPALVNEGTYIGVPIWGSLRMNLYYATAPLKTIFNGSLANEHPALQYMVLTSTGNPVETAMSFAYDEVKNQRITVLTEMANFGCAGVNLDYCRYPLVLGYEQPLLDGFYQQKALDARRVPPNYPDWVKYKCNWMTQFMATVYHAMNTAGLNRSRVMISARIPSNDYASYGYDPGEWLKEGLVDMIIPAYPGYDVWYDVLPWVDMMEGPNPKHATLCPGIEYFVDMNTGVLNAQQIQDGVNPGTNVCYSLEDYKRRAAEFYSSGADSIYIYNDFVFSQPPNARPTALKELGDKSWVRRWSEFMDGQKLRSEIITIP